MINHRTLRWVVIALALTTGCAKLKRGRTAAPPIIVAPPSSVPEAPPTIQAPPSVEQPSASQIPTLPPGTQPKVPQPVEPPKPVRNTRRTPAPKTPSTASSQPAVGQTAPAEPVPEAPAETPLPQLGAILKPEEQVAYNAAIDAALQRAQTNLAKLDPRRLRGSDRANYQRARSFIMQAQQARGTDLAVAKGLADRADILAQDLTRNLR